MKILLVLKEELKKINANKKCYFLSDYFLGISKFLNLIYIINHNLVFLNILDII